MTLAQIEDAIRAGIVALAGARPVIWQRQNAPRPDKPYIGLLPVRLIGDGDPEVAPPRLSGEDEDEEYVADLRTQTSVYVDLDFFGADALGDAWRLQRLLFGQTAGDAFGEDVAFLDAEAAVDVSGLRGDRFETRAQLSIRLRVSGIDTEALGIIETVNLERVGMPGGENE